MKRLRAWIGFLLGLVACLALSATALAAPALTLSPGVGPPTSPVRGNGTGFGATEGVDIFFDNIDWVLAATDGGGNFSQSFAVQRFSSQSSPGTHWITAIGRKSGLTGQKPFLVRTDWLQFHFGVAHRGLNPFENELDFNTVPSLAEAWVAHTGFGITSSPAVVNGVVYTGSEDSNLYAFRASTGTLVWKQATGFAITSSPAVAAGVVYVGSWDHKLYAFNAGSGAPLSGWPVSTGSLIESSPTVVKGVVYVGSDDHKLYAFGATRGNLLPGWPVSTGDLISSSPGVANGVVYVGSRDGNIYAFDAKAGSFGTFHWAAATGGGIVRSSPAVSDAAIYIGSTDGSMSAYNLTAGYTSLSRKREVQRATAAQPPDPKSLVPNRSLQFHR